MNDIKLVYLLTGEQLLAEVLSDEVMNLELKNPLRVGIVSDKQGQPALGIDSFMPLSDPDELIEIRQSAVVAVANPPQQLIDTYKSKFGQLITPGTGKLII